MSGWFGIAAEPFNAEAVELRLRGRRWMVAAKYGEDAQFTSTVLVTLPAAPADGDLILYEVTADPRVVWLLRYSA